MSHDNDSKTKTAATDQTSDFASLLADFEREQQQPGSRNARKPRPKVGSEVRGRVLSIGRDTAFVDLGGKDDGMLALDEVRGPDGQLTIAVGDEITARVVEIDGRAGCVVLRRMMGRGAEGRTELMQACELGIPVEGQVTGVVKGGVEVQVAGVRAFCPISQLELRHIEDGSEFVGQKLQFRISRCEESGRNLNVVLSRRSLLEEAAQVQATELRKKLAVGLVLRGKVTGLKDFGAFVDLGGINGMLHVSELSFQRARHPKEVLTVGQEVEVQVIRIDQSGDPRRPEKIALSLKSLEKDPWMDIELRFPEGSRLQGTVQRLEAYGAFVELEPGVDGLLHISEMGKGQRLHHAKEAMKVGERVDVVVQAVDRDSRRISLALEGSKSAVEAPGSVPSLASVNAGARLGTFADLLNKAAQKKK